jgi:hypothetical protein
MASQLTNCRRDPWTTLINLVLMLAAAVSALVAVRTLQLDFLFPFQPSVLTAPPAFLVLGPEPEPIGVVLTVTFANHGAKPGCVWDLALEVTAKTVGTKWVFFPVAVLDYSELIRADVPERPKVHRFFKETFTPIALSGRQQVEKIYLLRGRPPGPRPGHIMTSKFLTERESYHVDLYTATKEGDCGFVSKAGFVKRSSLELAIQNPDELKRLPPGSIVSLIDKNRDDFRERFLTEKIR